MSKYDLSKARRNPYAKYLNTEITVSVSNKAINFLQQESEKKGIPFQTLVNAVLMNYAGEGKEEGPLYKYERNIYWSEQDNAFIAEVPELPGCVVDGKTVEEAVKNVEEEITIWMETAKEMGWEIPQPKGRLYNHLERSDKLDIVNKLAGSIPDNMILEEAGEERLKDI